MTNKHLEASRSYYHDALTWCVQKSQPIPLWKYVLYLCNDPLVYIIFTITGLVVYSLAYYLQQFERHPKWDWFRISETGFRIYTGFACPYRAKNSSHRIFAAAVFLGAFLFNVVLCAKVIMFLTTSIQDIQVKSTEEIVKGNFQLIVDRFSYEKILQQNQVPLK